jgi:hypothetical protein
MEGAGSGDRVRVGEGGVRDQGAGGAALKALLAAMEGSAKRSLRYSRVAGFLSALETASLLAVAASLAAYVLTGGAHWQFAAAGAVSAAVAVASNRLQDRFYRKTLKELNRLELFAVLAALATGRTDLAEVIVKEKVEELKKSGGQRQGNAPG